MDMGFAVTCPLALRLLSGSCSLARAFASASFRPRLATAALALRYPSPPSGWCEDFHLASDRTCSAHRVRARCAPAHAALDRGGRCGWEAVMQPRGATAALSSSHSLLTAHTRNS